MVKKVSRLMFIILFCLMLLVPLTATFFQHEEMSVSENRRLAPPPVLVFPDGKLNPMFPTHLDIWMNDHIGFRKMFVGQNGQMHYYLFHKFPINNPYVLGPNGELNYVTPPMVQDYQHRNLYGDDYLAQTAQSLQIINDYAEECGAEFYYYQCWDKHSIYPEHFPVNVLQYGTASKTDGIIKAFIEQTDVHIISPKQVLIDQKANYETYSQWGDPTHWSHRGAYIGYVELMNAINADAPTPYRVLQEEDYTIKWKDQGLILFEEIHQKDKLEHFTLNNPQAVLTRDKLGIWAMDDRAVYFTNENAGNDTRLLLMTDSYFNYFFVDDLADSFGEVICFWSDRLHRFPEIMQAFEPDIVVLENAEREDRTRWMNLCADIIKAESKK